MASAERDRYISFRFGCFAVTILVEDASVTLLKGATALSDPELWFWPVLPGGGVHRCSQTEHQGQKPAMARPSWLEALLICSRREKPPERNYDKLVDELERAEAAATAHNAEREARAKEEAERAKEEAEKIARRREKDRAAKERADHAERMRSKEHTAKEELAAAKSPMRLGRWFACPLAFVVLQWLLLSVEPSSLEQTSAEPPWLLSATPTLWQVAVNATNVKALLPHTPETAAEGYAFGWQSSRYALLSCTGILPPPSECDELLRLAGAATGSPPLTPAQLEQTKSILLGTASHHFGGGLQRMLGLVSFVNVLWLISIIGLAATAAPAFRYIGSSLCTLLQLLGERIAALAVAFFEWVVLPLHRHGVFEVVAYYFAFALATQSRRLPPSQADVASYLALTSGLALIPCWSYSSYLWGRLVISDSESQSHVASTFCMLLAATLMPLALLHRSDQAQVTGFFTIVAAYCGLGFIMGNACGIFFVGFRSRAAGLRCIFASALVLAVFSSVRLAGPEYEPLLKPFAIGAMTMGSTMFFLALLILCSKWHDGDTSSAVYVLWNVGMLAALALALALGWVG